jgi:hypothetical protein
MKSITITDVSRASQAGEWCHDHLRHEDWQLNVTGLFSKHVRYEFGFVDPKHAVEFALRFV